MKGQGTNDDISVRYRIDLPMAENRLCLSNPEESQGTLTDQGSGRSYNDQRELQRDYFHF